MKAHACLAAVLLMALSVRAQSAGADPPFAGTNTFVSNGSHYGRFDLPVAATLSYADIETTSPNAALLIYGNPTGFWLLKGGTHWIGEGPGAVNHSFKAGTYFVYLIGTSGSILTATVRFDGLSGSSSAQLPFRTNAAIGDLQPAGAVPGLERFTLSPPFGGQAFAFIFTLEHFATEAVWSQEWRMATPDGIAFCLSSVANHGAGSSRLLGMFHDGGYSPPLNLSYYRQGVGRIDAQQFLGYWIERAPDDVPKFWGTFAAPAWGLTDGSATLDQDALCARSTPGFVVMKVEHTLPGGAPIPPGFPI